MTGGIEISTRDIEVLRTLFASRLMTLSQAALLHFNGSYEAAKQRIQKLKRAAMIGERKREPRERSVLFLTKQGFKELKESGHIDDFPRLSWEQLQRRVQVSDTMLAHELDVMDVKAAICAAVRKTSQFRIAEFSTWPKLYEFETMAPPDDRVSKPYLTVRPDGFIRIEKHNEKGLICERAFFLEVDRSSESQGVLVRKACCYRDYYRRGGFAARFGLRREEYYKAPFVVLMVFKTEKRRDNTAETLLNLTNPILSQAWLATLDDLTLDPLGAIWLRPSDYRYVTKRTVSDLRPDPNSSTYRNSREHEAAMERAMFKRGLFDEK